MSLGVVAKGQNLRLVAQSGLYIMNLQEATEQSPPKNQKTPAPHDAGAFEFLATESLVRCYAK